MTPKQLLRLALVVLAALVTIPAAAVPNKDAATLKKIDEAVNVHYIAAQFDKAESVLLAAIKACGAKACSGEVIAKAYIYVGVIRGNGKGDLAGARQAFENAQAADPNVTLDPTLVTPAVLAEFNKVMGKESDTSAAKAEKRAAEEDENAPQETNKSESKQARVAPVGELRCSPATGYEIQTARPVPIQCERMENVMRGELYYKPVGAEEYTAVLMKFNTTNATLRAEIPCEALVKKGTLSLYVIGQDENKDLVETFGNALSPVQYTIVDKTKQPPPSYPGEAAPKRCTDIYADEPGAGPGQACTEDNPCRKGNYCSSGICRKTPTCESNAECESDKCVDGLCEMQQEYASKSHFRRFMVGLSVAQDLWISPSVKNVCGDANAANNDYSCYNAGSTRVNQSDNPAVTNRVPGIADSSGNIKTTLVPATTRILASLDYAVTPVVTVGTRLGLAINTPPPTIHYAAGAPPTPNKSFFPAHVELRASYWFAPLDQPGFHPYLGISAGAAEVDAKVTVKAYYVPQAGDTCQKVNSRLCAKSLDAWRKMGRAFGGLNFGGLMKLGDRHNVVLNINAMYMLPSSGLVLEPSLGYLFGF